jgi:hypothetical protein
MRMPGLESATSLESSKKSTEKTIVI